VRGLWLIAVFALGACKSAESAARPDPLVAQCQRDPASDPGCVKVLTGGGEEYESRAEIMAAEEQKEADAFQSRLEKLRAQAEAKAAATRTSTLAAEEPGGPVIEDDDETTSALDELAVAEEDEVETGSSVRAIKAAPRGPDGKVPVLVVPPILPVKTAPKDVAKTAEPTPVALSALSGAPTPEEYLRSGRCLIEADLPGIRTVVGEGQKQKASRQMLGAAALLILDAEGLRDALSDELKHRGLVKARPLCADSQLRGVQALLRSLVGDPPKAVSGADAYGKGLTRMRAELEVRAGLPRRE
jgi:hypothetical protein